MPFNNRPCPKCEYLCAIEELEKILDEDKYPEGGDEKNKTGGVVLS